MRIRSETETVDDLRFGSTVRSLRLHRGWRQADLATAAASSGAAISRIERGHLDSVAVGTLRGVAAALDVRVDLVPRWRGGDLDRLLNRRHARLHESFARRIRGEAGWTMRPEVSFSIYGERGVIDVLGWHAACRMLLVVELKTDLVDVMDLLSTMDRRRRLAPRIAAELGWEPAGVSTLVVLTGSRTNRRRVAEHRTVLRTAFPDDGRRLAGWLRDPRASVGILAMWPDLPQVDRGPARRPRRRTEAGPGEPIASPSTLRTAGSRRDGRDRRDPTGVTGRSPGTQRGPPFHA